MRVLDHVCNDLVDFSTSPLGIWDPEDWERLSDVFNVLQRASQNSQKGMGGPLAVTTRDVQPAMLGRVGGIEGSCDRPQLTFNFSFASGVSYA